MTEEETQRAFNKWLDRWWQTKASGDGKPPILIEAFRAGVRASKSAGGGFPGPAEQRELTERFQARFGQEPEDGSCLPNPWHPRWFYDTDQGGWVPVTYVCRACGQSSQPA